MNYQTHLLTCIGDQSKMLRITTECAKNARQARRITVELSVGWVWHLPYILSRLKAVANQTLEVRMTWLAIVRPVLTSINVYVTTSSNFLVLLSEEYRDKSITNKCVAPIN